MTWGQGVDGLDGRAGGLKAWTLVLPRVVEFDGFIRLDYRGFCQLRLLTPHRVVREEAVSLVLEMI